MRTKFLALFLGGLLGVFAVLPHPAQHVPKFLGYAAIVAVATVAGTYLEPRTRLEVRSTLRGAAFALGAGVVTAAVLVLLGRTLFATHAAAPPIWTGALYALYGGVTEEVVFHYGLLTALAWLALRLAPEQAAYLLAITVSAVAMGLVHSPTAGAAILVALGGAVTGWIYWRRGLVAAMVAHAAIGFALHVWTPGVYVLS